MKADYFVLYERDSHTELEGRDLYGRCRSFSDLEKAVDFTVKHLPAILAREGTALDGSGTVRDFQTPYVVGLYFEEKYIHSSYDGSRDPVPAYEVLRCTEGTLDDTLRKVERESPQKMYLGVELKLTAEKSQVRKNGEYSLWEIVHFSSYYDSDSRMPGTVHTEDRYYFIASSRNEALDKAYALKPELEHLKENDSMRITRLDMEDLIVAKDLTNEPLRGSGIRLSNLRQVKLSSEKDRKEYGLGAWLYAL